MSLSERSPHRQVWVLALPMMLSNLTIPLLGIVDTAVMGHMPGAEYIGGVSVGAMIFSFVFWGFGFLRMGTTGLTAQAYGNNHINELRALLLRAALIALLVSFLLLLLQPLIKSLAFYLLQASESVERLGQDYFDIRLWAIPAVLLRYVLIGWFFGMQNARAPLYILLAVNGLNAVLDILFVVYLDMAVAGVAWATVVAEYIGVLLAFVLVINELKKYPATWQRADIFNLLAIKRMLSVNRDIFLRTLILIVCFAFFTAKSAEFGDLTLAANTILMNLLLFMSYGLDGFAHAIEALAGKALGQGNRNRLMHYLKITGAWSVLTALLYMLAYIFFGQQIVALQTDIAAVYNEAMVYLPWLIAMPLIGVWAFWLDGIFIGATLAVAMRNCMIVSGVIYGLVWYATLDFGNHGLWLAMSSYMAVRGLMLGATLIYLDRVKNHFSGRSYSAM